MTETPDIRLTGARLKKAIRDLREHRQKITIPCPDCGGPPFAIGELARICLICEQYIQVVGYDYE